jgi:undecaprenyl-phosphate 4-deoxy-4-formamido-L-arabinose transferase
LSPETLAAELVWAFRATLRDAFSHHPICYVSIDVPLTWGADSFGAVELEQDPRREGRARYTLAKLIIHAPNMTTGYSTWPLQVASIVGFVFTLSGFSVLLFVVGR